jgi:hypothetical protein
MFHEQFFEHPFRCIVRKRQMGDILWPGTRPCLISNRVLNLFREAELSGFEVRPADVRLMFPHDPKDAVFWQLIVTGWGGIAHPDSGIHKISHPTRERVYSHCTNAAAILDCEQWDGSDFFIVWPLPNYWWVTSRVEEVLRKGNFRHCRLVRPEHLRFAESVDEVGFGPGRLSQYFTMDRARAIGEPLGIH